MTIGHLQILLFWKEFKDLTLPILFWKELCIFREEISSRAFSRAKNRPHVLVAYLSSEIKTPDDVRRYNTHVHINVCLMHNYINVLMLIWCVVEKSAFKDNILSALI